MTRTNYRPLSKLSITEIETIFSGYASLVDALDAQTHTWQRPVPEVVTEKRQRGFARLFTFKQKVAKHA